MIATNKPFFSQQDDDALALYSIMARDWDRFIEELSYISERAIQILYKLLTYGLPPDEIEDNIDRKLNARGAAVVQAYASKQRIPLCRVGEEDLPPCRVIQN